MTALIESFGGRGLRGVFHAFSDTAETYRRLRACGDFAFGIGGVATFRKSPLTNVLPEMDPDDLVLETDCPYLTPVPYRGRRSDPAYVALVCQAVARATGLTADELAARTTRRAERMFGLQPAEETTKTNHT